MRATSAHRDDPRLSTTSDRRPGCAWSQSTRPRQHPTCSRRTRRRRAQCELSVESSDCTFDMTAQRHAPHATTTTLTLSITIQCNILLLQSHTDRCESDIHNDMYDSITDNCHAGQYCGKYCTSASGVRSILTSGSEA